MKAWFYYTRLAASDLVRLWSTTQHHVIIVTGICLPILLLMGLKQGHVAKLREDLLTSPTGRQVVFWSAQGGALLDEAAVEKLHQELPNVDVIIPETQRIVQLSRVPENEPLGEETGKASHVRLRSEAITLYSTRPGDPILGQAGGDVLEPGERAIVLSQPVADSLNLTGGEPLRLTVERRRGGAYESASVDVGGKAVVDFGTGSSAIGYADLQILDWLEQYVRGYRVDELDWPALKAAVPDKYAGYLVFCERTSDLTEDDRGLLEERGLLLRPLEDEQMRTLYGLLGEQSLHKMNAYFLASVKSEDDPRRRLGLAPSDITEPLEADCVVIPWNNPVTFDKDGQKYTLIGLSMPKRIWLRQYLDDPDKPFDYEADAFSARWLSETPPIADESLTFVLGEGDEFAVAIVGPPSTENVETSTAETSGSTAGEDNSAEKDDAPVHRLLVPANLPAYLDAYANGLAVYDAQVGLFTPTPIGSVYGKARLYAATIDDVPAIVDELSERDFALMSENERITEIHDQDRSLQLLVYVVGIGVFLFGVVTVFSVLLDSTDRKRNTIGILRVMGVSKGGVFYLVILRAAAIGVLAGLLSVAVGYLLALVLEWPAPEGWVLAAWKPTVSVILAPLDICLVFFGALVCSGVGALLPAWKAARMDPFDAVVEGRFH